MAADRYITVYILPGDCDGDGDLDWADYVCLADCLTGPGGGVLSGCGTFDAELDSDVDLSDFSRFQADL